MTPIPYFLNIVTTTKPAKMGATHPDMAVFPAPPLNPAEVEFRLVRDLSLTADTWTAKSSAIFVCDIGGCGRSAAVESAEVEVMKKAWIPSLEDEKKQIGSWKQEVKVKSKIYLDCTPAFESELIRLDVRFLFLGKDSLSVTERRPYAKQYRVRLKVDFPGIGNALKAEFPLLVVSCMPPSGKGPAWDGPPPDLSLPPSVLSLIRSIALCLPESDRCAVIILKRPTGVLMRKATTEYHAWSYPRDSVAR